MRHIALVIIVTGPRRARLAIAHDGDGDRASLDTAGGLDGDEILTLLPRTRSRIAGS